MNEEVLAGGVANPGAVVRVGNTVRRPRKQQTDTVHRFLEHLLVNGLLDAVPTPQGFDEEGREILSYLEGDIALPPHTAWTAGYDLLASVAKLQRQLQIAARDYQPPADAVWDDDVGTGYYPAGIDGHVVCHNDLCVENIVIRDGRAAAVIDFDYARPVDPLFDTAVAIRHWAPLRSPHDLATLDVDIDVVARFRLFLDVHELAREARDRVIQLADAFLERAFVNVRRLADGGHEGFAAMVGDGYLDQNRRSVEWLRANRADLAR